MISFSQSNPKYILYSYEQALDAVADLGVIPQRLWKVLYPLYRVEIETDQRSETNFNSIEKRLLTAIAQAELRSVEDLARFFALDQRLVKNLVNRLQAIGHIELAHAPLTITELGLDSLRNGRAQSQLLTRHVLYFDAINCQPLLRDHYKPGVQVYTLDEIEALRNETETLRDFEQIAYIFLRWDETAIERLKARPDYYAYNLPDEIKIDTLHIRDDRDVDRLRDVVYLPVYAIERQPDERSEIPPILAFSRVKGYRDLILEKGLNSNNDDVLGSIFQGKILDDLQKVVTTHLRNQGHTDDEWVFVPNGSHGPEVQLKEPRI